MSDPKHPEPGNFCWVEVATLDSQAAQEFYAGLLGWHYEERATADFGSYTFCHCEGEAIAGLYPIPNVLREQGLLPHWMLFVAVSDCERTCAAVRLQGGSVEQGPVALADWGRMAICRDPQGALFSLWQAGSHTGSRQGMRPGAPCWYELATDNPSAAANFYGAVFGWGFAERLQQEWPALEILAPLSKTPLGGLMTLAPQHGQARPHWTIYFLTQNCAADVERALALGARVVVPPTEIPGNGSFAVLCDPAGASFALVEAALPKAKRKARAPRKRKARK